MGRSAVVRRWISRVLVGVVMAGIVLGQSPIEPAGGAVATIVVRTATATSLIVTPPSPTAFGQQVVLTATVKKAPGLVTIDGRLLSPIEIKILFGSLVPPILTGNEPVTGSVTFFDGSSALATVPLSGGTASLATTSLGVGTHNLRAEFAVSGHWHSSTSNVVAHEVTKLATTTVLGVSPTPSSFGQSVALTATVSPSSAAGSVEFFDGATSLGSAAVVGGVASTSTSTLSVGSHSLSATYGGSATHLASTSSTVTHIVNKAVTTTVLTASPNPVVVGDPVTLTATVSPSSAGGTVTFFDGATSLGSAPVVGGAAVMSTSSLALGSHPLAATYGGSATHTASTSAVVSLGVKHPDLIMSADQALCGTHVFDTLEVPTGVTLSVAQTFDATSVTDLDGGAARPRCPVGIGTDHRGTLTIQARVIVIDGEIDGFAIQEVGPPNVDPAPVGPVGNAGAGHAGAGGAGRVGGGSTFNGNPSNTIHSGGAAYGDTTNAIAGHPGSPADNFTTDDDDPNGWGRGGAAVIISASESVVVAGTINVDGGAGRNHNGQTTFLGDCGQPFIPDPDAGTPGDDGIDETIPFIQRSGHAGDGGGSGGTIAIGAPLIDLRGGLLSAQGGDGGHGFIGGGGGGSGGTTKLVAPTLLLDAGSGPFVGGGSGGLDLCASPATPSPIDNSYNDNGSNGATGTIAQ